MGMSFKKPFRAVPVKLSPAYIGRQQRDARMTLALRLVGAFAFGLVAALALHWFRSEPTASPPIEPALVEASIVMSEPAVRERPMSAAELDAQQPSVRSGFAETRIERRPIPSFPITGTFRNCSAARAAGAAPLYRGQPGYGAHMDEDNDGIACEPFMALR